GEDTGDGSLLDGIGLYEGTDGSLVELTSELFGKRARKTGDRRSEQTCKREKAPITQPYVGIALDLLDQSGLDGHIAPFQLGQFLLAWRENAIEKEGDLAPFGQEQRVVHGSWRRG